MSVYRMNVQLTAASSERQDAKERTELRSTHGKTIGPISNLRESGCAQKTWSSFPYGGLAVGWPPSMHERYRARVRPPCFTPRLAAFARLAILSFPHGTFSVGATIAGLSLFEHRADWAQE